MRAAIITVALVLVPDWALACAACGFGEDESRIAYIGTTAFLSFSLASTWTTQARPLVAFIRPSLAKS